MTPAEIVLVSVLFIVCIAAATWLVLAMLLPLGCP